MKSTNRTKILSLSVVAVAACALTVSYAKGGLSYVFREKAAAGSSHGGGANQQPSLSTAPAARYNSQTSARPDMTERHLSGRAIASEEAVKASDSIIVGKIVSLGDAESDAPGQEYYGRVKVSVLRTMKGSAVAAKTLDMSLTVQVFSTTAAEERPETNREYIIFLKRPDPRATKAIKLLVADTRNLDHISSLAASASNK